MNDTRRPNTPIEAAAEIIASALRTLASADHGEAVGAHLAPAIDRLADEVANAAGEQAEAVSAAAAWIRDGLESIATALARSGARAPNGGADHD